MMSQPMEVTLGHLPSKLTDVDYPMPEKVISCFPDLISLDFVHLVVSFHSFLYVSMLSICPVVSAAWHWSHQDA